MSLVLDGSNGITMPVGSQSNASCVAWLVLSTSSNGGATTLVSSYNIASVSKTSAGIFSVTFTNPIQDANYCVQISCAEALGNGSSGIGQIFSSGLANNYTAPTTSGFGFITMHVLNLNVQDCARICVSVYR